MDRGGNYWTLFTPGIWKVLHAVSQFFEEQSIESLLDAIDRLERLDLRPTQIAEHARQFDASVFERRMRAAINLRLAGAGLVAPPPAAVDDGAAVTMARRKFGAVTGLR